MSIRAAATLIAIMGVAVGAASAGDTRICETAGLTVTGGTAADRDRVCGIADREVPRLAECHVPVPEGLTLHLSHALPTDCMGVYHCGEAWIEILPPDIMAERRRHDRAFAAVPDAEYFDSVVVHELTHAAHDRVACPYESCIATSEYLAYAMQVRSLPWPARAAFEGRLHRETPVVRDELNAMYYAFAPHRFAQKAWLHFRQRPDGCAFVAQLMAGHTFLDRGRF